MDILPIILKFLIAFEIYLIIQKIDIKNIQGKRP